MANGIVNTHRLTESDFRFDVTFYDGGHNIISHRQVLPLVNAHTLTQYIPGTRQQHSISSWSV